MALVLCRAELVCVRNSRTDRQTGRQTDRQSDSARARAQLSCKARARNCKRRPRTHTTRARQFRSSKIHNNAYLIPMLVGLSKRLRLAHGSSASARALARHLKQRKPEARALLATSCAFSRRCSLARSPSLIRVSLRGLAKRHQMNFAVRSTTTTTTRSETVRDKADHRRRGCLACTSLIKARACVCPSDSCGCGDCGCGDTCAAPAHTIISALVRVANFSCSR